MQKEDYFTEDNCNSKIASWEAALSHSKRWKKYTTQNTALLVIDMQNYFLDPKSHAFIPSNKIIVRNILRLINLYRSNNLPIIFTYFAIQPEEKDSIGNWWNDTVYDNSHESKIINQIQPKNSDLVLRKKSYSAFHDTKLKEYLKSKNITNILISGVLTNLCCDTTARDAFMRNLNVFLPIDATAAYNEEMHLSTLKNLSYGFATPISMKKIIKNDL